MPRPLEVLVVEPHLEMRTSLCGVLAADEALRIAGTAADMLSALRLAARRHADVAVVDDRAATLGSAASVDALAALARRVPVVVIGMGEPAAYTRPYLEAGACGYWCKTAEFEELVPLMRAAATARPRAA